MRKIRKHKKKILLVLIAIITALIVWAFFLLSHEADADSRFIRDLDRGLTASWAQKNDEFGLQKKQGSMSAEFIELEYEAVSKYKDNKFRSKKLGKLVKQYITALEECREAAGKADPNKDFDKFWDAFSEPYGERIKALYAIYHGNYGLELSDPSYQKKKDMFLVQGWMLNKIEDISFTRKTEEDGTVSLRAKVKNDSGYDLKYVDLELALYDKKGKVKEKMSVYAEDISKGSEFRLMGYQVSDSEVTGYKIVSETCEIKN